MASLVYPLDTFSMYAGAAGEYVSLSADTRSGGRGTPHHDYRAFACVGAGTRPAAGCADNSGFAYLYDDWPATLKRHPGPGGPTSISSTAPGRYTPAPRRRGLRLRHRPLQGLAMTVTTGRGRILLRGALAAVVAFDLVSFYGFISAVRADAARAESCPAPSRLPVAPAVSAAVIVLGVAGAVAFAIRPGRLWEGALALARWRCSARYMDNCLGRPGATCSTVGCVLPDGSSAWRSAGGAACRPTSRTRARARSRCSAPHTATRASASWSRAGSIGSRPYRSSRWSSARTGWSPTA